MKKNKINKWIKNKIKSWLFDNEDYWEIIYRELREILDKIIIELETPEVRITYASGCCMKDKADERYFIALKFIEIIEKITDKKETEGETEGFDFDFFYKNKRVYGLSKVYNKIDNIFIDTNRKNLLLLKKVMKKAIRTIDLFTKKNV